MKVENIITQTLEEAIEFDGKLVKKIQFDLEHINRGWNQNKNDYNSFKRSNYNAQNIICFFEQFSYYSIEWDDGPAGNKSREIIRGKNYFRYIAFITDHENNELKKIVIDLPEDYKETGIIVTIY